MAENIGKVISISGPAVDVQFEESKMPPIFQAIRIVSDGFNVPTPLDVIVRRDLPEFRRTLDVARNPVCARCVCSMKTGWRGAPWQ